MLQVIIGDMWGIIKVLSIIVLGVGSSQGRTPSKSSRYEKLSLLFTIVVGKISIEY